MFNLCLLFKIANLLHQLFFLTVVIFLTSTTLATFACNLLKKLCAKSLENIRIFHSCKDKGSLILSFILYSFDCFIDFLIFIDYILFIIGRLFKYLFITVFIVFKHFFLLFLLVIFINCTYTNITNIHTSYSTNFTANNYTLGTFMAEDISKYDQKGHVSASVTSPSTQPKFLQKNF